MKIEQKKFTPANGWETVRQDGSEAAEANLVIAFGGKSMLADEATFRDIRKAYPQAQILINSTAGEIIDTKVHDDSISLTAVTFKSAWVKTASLNIQSCASSFDAGAKIASSIDGHELRSVLVVADGQLVNGSDLVSGLLSVLRSDVVVTGGLAGDGPHFKSTLVGLNEQPSQGIIAAVGFYGPLFVTYGSMGGWTPFGPELSITRSEANVLFELDGQPALDVYKRYLGDKAGQLPGSALLFPLNVKPPGQEGGLVRTILNVNEKDKSLTFAGNLPQGHLARLMRASDEHLIEGSSMAAVNSLGIQKPDLAILISCVGRKLVLGRRIEEEVEAVRAAYGNYTALSGFYSYGEISPSGHFAKCELHNQTMTITTFSEF